MRCAVFGCNSDDQAKAFKTGDFQFFRFPKEEELCKAWEKACSRKDNFNVKNARVCSKHFKSSDLMRNFKQELLGHGSKNFRPLKPNVIPNENLPTNPSSFASISSSAAARLRPGKKRSSSNLVDTLLNEEQFEKKNLKMPLMKRQSVEQKRKIRKAKQKLQKLQTQQLTENESDASHHVETEVPFVEEDILHYVEDSELFLVRKVVYVKSYSNENN